jgi:predicted nucleic acid-binding protein
VNVYVETNFVLELVFQQEQSSSCEDIVQECEAGRAMLVVPAYSLAEPHEKLQRQARNRRALQQELDTELRQLARTASYDARIASIQDIARLLIQSNEEEQQRFAHYRQRILHSAHVVALTATIVKQAATYETTYDLGPQDAMVYASVISHLQKTRPTQACFLNRNFKDFKIPDVVDDLAQYQCTMIPHFDHGLRFIQAQSQP